MKLIGHLKTITIHKIKVGKLCFKLHLYKQGILHDLSKYSITELKTGMKYYQGNRSPNGEERRVKGYSLAWLHHKGRNKHHWEFWIDFTHQGLVPIEMPFQYLKEMFCDRVAASMVYRGKEYEDSYPLYYFNQGIDHYYMHPETKKVLQYLLEKLAKEGLDETINYINTHQYEEIKGEIDGKTTKSNGASRHCIEKKK